MSGIYIHGMEMPKEGNWTTVRIYPDGTCAVPNWQGDCTLIKGAKAFPVPKHGRLIDADALLNEGADLCLCEYDDENTWGFSYDMINDAPTVIPASEEDET